MYSFNNLINMKVILIIVVLCFTFSNCQTPSQEIVAGNNLFAASIFKEIRKKETGNILVSPFSAETVLALTQLGAKDGTASKIRQVLHLPNSQEKIVAGFKRLQSSLKNNKNYTLKTANKIYVQKQFEIRDQFKKAATEGFDSAIENIDFAQKNEAAKIMNTWVEKNTENKIKNLISADSLDEATRLILINALYFKGNWTLPFSNDSTRKENFHKTVKEIVQVDMMQATAVYNYYESPELNAKFLELFFKGQDVSMTFVLPNQIKDLPNLEKQIDRVFVAPKYRKTRVIVALPKFKIEYKIDFTEILLNLGVHEAFDANEVDFSGISGKKGDLVIDQVVQKSYIDVNEGGVEAAAATFVGIVAISALVEPESSEEFIADHPFIFYIKVKDLIIFYGRVVSPKV